MEERKNLDWYVSDVHRNIRILNRFVNADRKVTYGDVLQADRDFQTSVAILSVTGYGVRVVRENIQGV